MSRETRFRRRAGRDDGTVLVLALASVLLALAVTLALADTSSLFMRRTALMTVADNAAIAAATAVDVESIYADGVGGTLGIDPSGAHLLAADAVAAVDDARLDDVRLDSVDVRDGIVSVIVSARVPRALSGLTVGDRAVRIRAQASASAPTRW